MIIAGFVSSYLYVDKFLFRGQLGRLFRDGWRQYLRGWLHALVPGLRHRKSTPAAPAVGPEVVSLPAEYDLTERKRYVSCQRVPAGDIGPKTESKAEGNDTFAPTTDTAPEPEVTEWRAPSFQKKGPPRGSAGTPQRWEDERFAEAEYDPREESEEFEIADIPDMEQMRREVAEMLEQIQDEQMRAALEPTDEEKYGIEPFDTGTY